MRSRTALTEAQVAWIQAARHHGVAATLRGPAGDWRGDSRPDPWAVLRVRPTLHDRDFVVERLTCGTCGQAFALHFGERTFAAAAGVAEATHCRLCRPTRRSVLAQGRAGPSR